MTCEVTPVDVINMGPMGDDEIVYFAAATKDGRTWCEEYCSFYGVVGGRQLYKCGVLQQLRYICDTLAGEGLRVIHRSAQ